MRKITQNPKVERNNIKNNKKYKKQIRAK